MQPSAPSFELLEEKGIALDFFYTYVGRYIGWITLVLLEYLTSEVLPSSSSCL